MVDGGWGITRELEIDVRRSTEDVYYASVCSWELLRVRVSLKQGGQSGTWRRRNRMTFVTSA